MRQLTVLLLAITLAACSTTKESTTTTTDVTTTVRDTVEVHVVDIPADTSTTVLEPVPVTNPANVEQPDTVLAGVTDSGVRVTVNPRTRVATVVTPRDSVVVLDRDTVAVTTSTTTTQTDVRVGDSFWQDLKDYAVGGAIFLVLLIAAFIIAKIKGMLPW